MKKLFIACILILSLFGLTSAATLSGVSAIGCKFGPIFGPELVTNGGMEDGDPPTGWITVESPDNFEQSITQVHSGIYSCRYKSSSSSWADFHQAVDLPIYKPVRLSFWYYLVSGQLTVKQTDNNGSAILYNQTFTNTGEWTYVIASYTSTYPINPEPGVDALISFGRDGAFEIYIDDVSIKEIQ